MKPHPIAITIILVALVTLLIQAAETTTPTTPISPTRPPPSRAGLDSLRERQKAGQDNAAKWVGSVDASKAKITYFFLDPASRSQAADNAQQPGYLHDWKIIGSQVLATPEDKKFILTALLQAIHDYDYNSAGCFTPQFGLRIETDKGTPAEVVICFHCVSARVYGENAPGGFGVKGPAVNDFLALVKKLHLDPAEKK